MMEGERSEVYILSCILTFTVQARSLHYLGGAHLSATSWKRRQALTPDLLLALLPHTPCGCARSPASTEGLACGLSQVLSLASCRFTGRQAIPLFYLFLSEAGASLPGLPSALYCILHLSPP